jgi:hypothetical protein
VRLALLRTFLLTPLFTQVRGNWNSRKFVVTILAALSRSYLPMPAPATRYALVWGGNGYIRCEKLLLAVATCYRQNFREFFWWERSA